PWMGGEQGGPPLHTALESGNQKIVELLVRHGADVNGKEKDNNVYLTPLGYAVKYADRAAVRFLLKKGADVNAGFMPALHCAAEARDIELMALFLKKGANINQSMEGENQDTPLGIAANQDDIAAVRFLLGKGADVNLKNREEYTPLHHAARNGNKEMVELLLKNGATGINDPTTNQYTPLWLAAWSGNKDLVCYLLQQDAVIQEEPSLLLAAVRSDDWEMFEFLQDTIQVPEPAGWKDIWETALRMNNPEMIQYLIETIRLDVNEKIQGRFSERLPLEIVASNKAWEEEEEEKNQSIFNYLIENGAKPELINDGEVIEWAIRYSNDPTFDYFLEQGFSFADRNSFPYPSYFYPLEIYSFHVAEQLMQQQEEVPAYFANPIFYFVNWCGGSENDDPVPILEFLIKQNSYAGYYPAAFLRCLRNNDLASAILFLRAGVDINVKDRKGLNALWWVRDTDIAEYLLLHGIDVTVPLVYEEELIDIAVLKTFKKYGIPICLPQEYLDKALRVAASFGDAEMVDYFIRKGADVNGYDTSVQEDKVGKRTPLHENAWMGYETYSYTKKVSPKVIRQLIKAGADIHAEDENGETALEYTLGEPRCNRVFRGSICVQENHNGWYPSQDYSLLAIELIEAGADIHRLNKKGYTPLMQAIENKYENVIQLLLEKGVDVNFCAEDGATPLSLAIQQRKTSVVRLLIEAGAKPDDGKKNSVFDKIGDTETFLFLREAGYAEYITPDGLGRIYNDLITSIPLDTCLLDDLLALGLSLDYPVGWEKEPALFRAVKSDQPESVTALLKRGIEVNLRDWCGDTPLIKSIRYSCSLRLIECLLEYGADPYIKNLDGNDAFTYAEEKEDILHLLNRYAKK
ncbi:MAG: ankyrin repeat domain-containing protein, partial [Tannerellaceae bacterium]|nr:ankyrin repeat domain-containing protein [Tannerellaceae bacterium]